MKKLLAITALVIASITILPGCPGSSSSSPSPSYTMTVTVGGVAHTFTNVYATLNGTDLAITANSGTTSGAVSYPAFSTVIYTYSAPATYTITSGSSSPTVEGTYATDATVSDWVVAVSGSATITSLSSTTVTGSVSFTNSDGTTSTGTFTAKRI